MDLKINNLNNTFNNDEKNSKKIEITPEIKVDSPKSAGDTLKLSDVKKSTREERPLTISLNASFPNGLNLAANYNITDRFSVGGSVGTLGIINDYAVHGRYYFAGWERTGLYAQTGAHLVQNNLHGIFGGNQFAGAVSETVGIEFRAKNGFTINTDVGMAVAVAGTKVSPIPAFNVGLGYSF